MKNRYIQSDGTDVSDFTSIDVADYGAIPIDGILTAICG
jgi:hypothetical protein